MLRGNPINDPAQRPLWVYTPPGYDDAPERRYPVTYLLLGYAGTLPVWRNRTAFRKPVPELADEIFARGEAPGMLLVFVDAWTTYGGSQFIDSPGTGRHHSYLCEEVVPYVDARYRTLPARDHRAIAGKSSGGLGATVTSMLRPDLFGAFATHSGDSLSEAQYHPHLLTAARQLRPYGGDIFRWWDDFRSRAALSRDTRRRRISIGALLGGRALACLRLACVTNGPVKPFEAADSGDRHPFARDNCADHGVEDRIDCVGGLLPPTELVSNRFDELILVHVHPGR